MRPRKTRKNDIVISKNNVKVTTGERVGTHPAVVIGETENGKTPLRLITHSTQGTNKKADRKRFNKKGSVRIDEDTHITEDIFEGEAKLIKKSGGKYYV
jgi:hypothetical protein